MEYNTTTTLPDNDSKPAMLLLSTEAWVVLVTHVDRDDVFPQRSSTTTVQKGDAEYARTGHIGIWLEELFVRNKGSESVDN